VWVRVATQDHSDEGHIQRLINFHDQIFFVKFWIRMNHEELDLERERENLENLNHP